MKKGISFLLTLVLLLTMFNVPVFALGYSFSGGGNGSTTTPYGITTWEDLHHVRDNLSANYKLVNDLTTGGIGYTSYAAATANGGQGWLPIGDSTTAFSGTFDGKGCTISDLKISINSSGDASLNGLRVGLFGSTNKATIMNVLLSNVDITVTAAKDSIVVGGLVGYGHATISNCAITGTIVGTATSNSAIVGGLVGQTKLSTDRYYTTITKCSASSTVTGNASTGAVVGGLVGKNYQGNIYHSALASGKVSGTGGTVTVGGLVGESGGGSISDSSASGTIAGIGTSGEACVGGLAGYAYEYDNIYRSYAAGSVSGTAVSSAKIGGLVGWLDNKGGGADIYDSYASGNVISNGNNVYAGGLVGYTTSNILGAYATGNVSGALTAGSTGKNNVGGLVGLNYSGTIDKSYYAVGTVTGTGIGTEYLGSLVGSNLSTITASFWDKETSGTTGIGTGSAVGATGTTTAAMKTKTTFSKAQWGFYSFWTIVEGTSPASWSYPYFPWSKTAGMLDSQAPGYGEKDFAGSGTSDDPYQITSAADFNKIRNNLSAHYKLMNNIALSVFQSDYNDGKGWVPIGTSTAAFTGSFNGNGKTISGLYMAYGSSDSNIGLFGYISGPAVISNAALINVTVSGQATTVGGLVGYNDGGNIINSSVTGYIEGESNVGGLVGINKGSIQNSYTNVTVTGGGSNIGGLLGQNDSGSINNAYAMGAATGGDSVGGLVGFNNDGGSIGNTYYAPGNVSGTANEGSIVGNNAGTITNSFWDNETSGSTGVGTGTTTGVTGNTTGAMKTKSTFAGWSFTTPNGIWSIVVPGTNIERSYPFFQWMESLSGWLKSKAPGYQLDSNTGGGGTGGGGGGSATLPANGGVIVNGQQLATGNETTSMENGKSIVKLKLDNQAFGSILNAIKMSQNGKGNEIQLAINNTGAQVAAVDLSGDLVKNLEKNTVLISIKHNDVEYIIPAAEFNISKVAETLGMPESQLLNIQVEVKISKVDVAVVEQYKKFAAKNNDEILVTPITFEIKARVTKTDGTAAEVAIDKFRNFVERITQIPAGVDPAKITTGIVLNADGTYSHVPTEVFVKDGRYYAKLNSLTNSNYSVIWNPITVASVVNHWSEKAVNDMASRMVVFNTDSFAPDQAITRADFAEYIVRALGLYQQSLGQGISFADVSSTGDRTKAIQIANQFGIITGYPDGTFRPDQLITREEAMAMYQRAMTVAKLTGSDSGRYQNYADFSQVEEWARGYVKEVLSAHVFNGTTATTISPKANLTYAESAQAIRNLLTESKLINQ